MRNDFKSDYLAHWGLKKGEQKKKHRYVARVELANGQYRYFYSLKEYAAYLKAKGKYIYENKERLLAEQINKGAAKVEELYNKINKENKYLTDDYNYDRKIEQVKNTQEWQDIVKRNDPEYTKINRETGEKTYDIDSYLAKKKHPVLDAADDLIMGRPVKLNKLDKEAAVAGAADYGKTYVTMAALGTKFLLEKFKFSQGSYKEEKQQAVDYYYDNKKNIANAATQAQQMMESDDTKKLVSDGEKYINSAVKAYGNVQTIQNIAESKTNLSAEDYAAMKKEYEAMQKELEQYKKRKN